MEQLEDITNLPEEGECYILELPKEIVLEVCGWTGRYVLRMRQTCKYLKALLDSTYKPDATFNQVYTTPLYVNITLDPPNYRYYDILNIACKYGYIAIAKLAYNLGHDHMAMNIDGGLRKACRGGHRELVDLMIQLGSTAWTMGLDGACEGGHLELAQLMLSNGNCDFEDALEFACENGNLKIVQLLIDNGADTWNSGLYGACKGAHMDLVDLMIQKGADDWDWVLVGACRGGNINIVQFILSKRNDWTGRDLNEPLEAACTNGNREVVDLMIAMGANNWDWGLTGASVGGHINLMKLMIEKGATITYHSIGNAAAYGYIDIARFILDKNKKDSTILLLKACEYQNVDIAQVALEYMDEELKAVVSWTKILCTACSRGDVTLATLILNNIYGEVGWTEVLFVAARSGNPKLVKLILSKGTADINHILSKEGRTYSAKVNEILKSHLNNMK